MILKYTNTEEEIYDYVVYTRIHSRKFLTKLRSKRITYGIIALLSGGWGTFLMINHFRTKDDPVTSQGFLTRSIVMLVIAAICLFMIVTLRKNRENKVKRDAKAAMATLDKEAFSEIILKIDDKSFTWDTLDEDGSVPLTEDIGIVEQEDKYLVFTKKNGFIIPKRCFNENNTEEMFRRMMNVDNRIDKTQKKEAKIKEEVKKSQ